MFIDFRDYPRDQPIETDVCIIGAGAAGISLAHALKDSSLDVCLLETGGLEPDNTRSKLRVADTQRGNYSTAGCRLRYFGGSTNHWGGYNVPLDDIDFALRDWVPHSGWPIDRPELAPWYTEANTLLGAGAFRYTRAELQEGDWPFPDVDLQLLSDIYWRLSPNPTAFATGYQDAFKTAENISVFLHATVTQLHADTTGATVQRATVRDVDGNQTELKARFFVVAAGAMESSRLLLASNDVNTAGLGNTHDQLGRFFMMHPHVDIGQVVGLDDDMARLFNTYRQDNIEIIAGIGPSAASQASNRILNSSVRLQRLPDRTTGYAAMLQMRDELKLRYNAWQIDIDDYEYENDISDLAWTVLTDIDSAVAGVWRRSQNPGYVGESQGGAANIFVQSEQAPNPASRITLDTQRDVLGVPKMIADIQVLPIDKQTLRVMGELLGRELALRNGGRVQLTEWLLDDSVAWDRQMWGGCHHMGGARMSSTPTQGVVDADCKLHGVDNTYVASSAVFPTGGHANPTITIVALALRLADHLRSAAQAS
jgi:choline dehydrogenase-like flavoprotein